MLKKERQKNILNLLKTKKIIKTSEFVQILKVNRTTIYRDLQELIEQSKVVENSKGTYSLLKIDPIKYFQTLAYERVKKSYNFDFLALYIPNETKFFTKEQRLKIQEALKNLPIQIDTNFYKTNKRLLETMLIDLSFASSNLEGNTYDYLDTEVLIKYNEIAKDKTLDETQMILNHKKAIEYLIYYKNELPFTKQTFFEIHTLLGEKLLPKEELGVIRNRIVGIGNSSYTPLDNKFQLEEQFEIFLTKLNQIVDPYEQAIFILVFIPYFQLFMDINKRTSRMLTNLPLLKHNLPIISFIAINKKDYITAILAVYELNNTDLLADIFIKNYLLNLEKYI